MRILIPLFFLSLVACGQSGDLYLPEAQRAPPVAPGVAPQAAPAADEQKNEEEESTAPAAETAPATP